MPHVTGPLAWIGIALCLPVTAWGPRFSLRAQLPDLSVRSSTRHPTAWHTASRGQLFMDTSDGENTRQIMQEPSLFSEVNNDSKQTDTSSNGENAREVIQEPSLFSEVSDDSAQTDYLGESTRGDLVPNPVRETGMELDDTDAEKLAQKFGLVSSYPHASPPRGVFCSRALNMRSLQCIGYDMDYTLVHYRVNVWEGAAYAYAKERLRAKGFPVSGLEFDPELVVRGIIIDKELGNFVKADRFGYVRRAMHGTQRMPYKRMNEVYGREEVDLRDSSRWLFLNTLFSVSEGCLYAQLVDKLDSGELLATAQAPFNPELCSTYKQLYTAVSKAIFRAHVEGKLKEDIMANPAKFTVFEKEVPLSLLDQKDAGRKLLLITNSDWLYTKVMMEQVCDPFLPGDMTWRQLFDIVVVSARKPDFFSLNMPLYEIVTDDGMMKERFKMEEGKCYAGGSARMVEKLFKCTGGSILYVGDHILTDVNYAKSHMRWRTALVVRELEKEMDGLLQGHARNRRLKELFQKKEECAQVLNHIRTAMHRYENSRNDEVYTENTAEELEQTMAQLLATMVKYDKQIGPLLYSEGDHVNRYWGYYSRSSFTDKSHLMRQIEKYTDIYTSRVSNFLRYSPYMYFRPPQQSMAHDRNFDKYFEDQGLLDPSSSDDQPPADLFEHPLTEPLPSEAVDVDFEVDSEH